MRYSLLLCVSIMAVFNGCVPFYEETPMTQLQIREMQSREFDTPDAKLVVKAVMNVLQDEGYTIKSADLKLGFVSAEKLDYIGPRWISPQQTKMRSENQQIIDVSANVSEYGSKTRLRVNFQHRVLDNFGVVMSAQGLDAKSYQDFFEKVSKGIFIQQEKI